MTEALRKIGMHLAFVALLVLMTAGIVLHGDTSGTSLSTSQVFLLVSCSAVFVVAAYVNLLVLIPSLLLKGLRRAYGIGLVVEMLLVLVGIAALSSAFGDEGGGKPHWIVALNLLGVLALVMLVLVSTTSVAMARHNIREKQREDELMRARKEAELVALRRQVSPHFIFNMLNNAITLARVAPDEGADLLRQLNCLLHYQIEECREADMPLDAEVRHIRQFLEIEKVRHDDMQVTVEYDGRGGNVRIPALLFFPVVENAVKHNRPEGGVTPYINIAIGVDGGKLSFTCTNSRGRVTGPTGGLGLANLRRRLELVYPGRHSLQITETPTTFTLIIIIIDPLPDVTILTKRTKNEKYEKI